MLLVALSASAAVCNPPVPPAVFVCPPVPDEVIDDMPPVTWEWYQNELDPFCERLENAADAVES